MLRLQKQLLSLPRGGGCACPLPSPHRLLYSTASTTSASTFSVDDYLVTACGLTRAQVPRASRLLFRLNSPSKADAVLAFFSGLGLSRSDIAGIIASDPLLLRAKVDVTLAPRVDALRGLGLSDSEMVSLVLAAATMLRRSDVASKLKFWISVFGSFDELLPSIKSCNRILLPNLDTMLKPNIAYLKQCGLSAIDIAKLHFNAYWVLGSNPERLKELVMRADKLGVPRNSGQFKYALATVACVSQEKIDSRRETLKRALGCTDEQLRIAVVHHPSILRASVDKLRTTAEFLTTKVGLDPEYIVHRPAFFGYSLKRRLLPRYLVMKALQESGIVRVDYCSMVVVTETQFRSSYIDRHKESIPGLAEIYAACCSGEMPSELQS
ncbi:transcription termination factor MTERF8, chloroplastic-like [Oryza brachyantha]|uniref:Uncharacterized protein n=1 Tax=Oryza brachyantha TaxID=4533 RepID=J3MCK7_ORYBR|nr:transcription termination factor MTERF8, chloroplastic-like [Oryza brachyantha]